MSSRPLAAVMLALVLAAGCTAEPAVTRSTDAAVPTPGPSLSRAPDSDGLAAAKQVAARSGWRGCAAVR